MLMGKLINILDVLFETFTCCVRFNLGTFMFYLYAFYHRVQMTSESKPETMELILLYPNHLKMIQQFMLQTLRYL